MLDDDLAGILRALSHPARLTILRVMAEKQRDCCCADVAQCLPLAQSTVSQHIKVLLEAGLIERRARGVKNCYMVLPDRLAALDEALRALADALVGRTA